MKRKDWAKSPTTRNIPELGILGPISRHSSAIPQSEIPRTPHADTTRHFALWPYSCIVRNIVLLEEIIVLVVVVVLVLDC